MNKTVVYTRDGCTRCKHTIRLATALGMEPEVRNTDDPEANWGDYLIDGGWTELPVVEIWQELPLAPDDIIVDSWSGNKPTKLKEWA